MDKQKDSIATRMLRGCLTLPALLPLDILYIFADLLYILIYHVVRYRRAMVRRNLTICFPNREDTEIIAIEKRFYHNFADYIVETLKLLHVDDTTILDRFEFEGLDHITAPMAEGRSVIAYFAHCGNWEWAPSITLHCSEALRRGDRFCQIYRPLRNQAFDRIMLGIRSRFHSISIPKHVALRRFLEMRRDGVTSVTGFMSDQKPSHGDDTHTITFLGRQTRVITGTESLARRLGMAVVYWDMQKTGRGRYRIVVHPMSADASSTEKYELTDKYFSLLERTIERDPAIWLWSHNRWKNSPQ